ncbi:hypothetical protein [Patulibacter sp. SYSU D01012]|uniref:hypothetical protein n=1 Tax=Patulibacter sp. SYSU D01012 TaxID=2817381 RepID=UPI001B30C05F|nr:hypothetical protein [Patulibacter sp. SYSU D01012]
MPRRLPPPWALTVLLAVAFLLATPATTDLAAQAHRVPLGGDGAWLVDLSWFGGHHLPGYSVLLPVLGLVLGAPLIGALSAVAAAWAFGRLARAAWPGTPGLVAAWWFAAGAGGLLFTGRVAFLLGAACGLGTLVVATAPGRRPPAGRPAPAADPDRAPPAAPPSPRGTAARTPARTAAVVAGAALTALGSPVAALFLAMAGAAWTVATPRGARRTPAVLTVAAFVAACVLALGFPTGGTEPFVASALWPAVVALAACVLVLPRDQRVLRAGAALYLAAVLASGLLPTPMGGNATRLAALAGGPLLAGALWGRRPLALALLAVPFLYWQWYPPVRDAAQAYGDPSANAAHWRPLADELRARVAAAPTRVEVPPAARRGEARWIPDDVPLARGWVRQLDRDRNPLFYDDLRHGPLTGTAYRRWLDDQAVGWVALTDATPDPASRDEVALLRAGAVPGLTLARRTPDYVLWRVDRPRPLAAWTDGRGGPPPRVVRMRPGGLRVALPRPGTVDLRIRWSPYLRATRGVCLHEAPGGWTRMRAAVRGTVDVGTGLAVPWRRAAPAGCSG